MILRQFLHSDAVAASYLFGCGGNASGAVVDPVGDISPYLQAAAALGMRILYVIDTHLHADHVSSARALADVSGAEYVLFAAAIADFAFKGVQDGDVLEFGKVAAKVLHTPGNTTEHLCLVVADRTRASEPWFVRHNTAFRMTDEAEFVAAMTADIPPPPPGAGQNRAINSGQVVPA